MKPFAAKARCQELQLTSQVRNVECLALNLLLQLCQLSYSEVQEAKIGSKPEQFHKESWTVLNIRALAQTYTQSCGRNSTPANVSKSSGLWLESQKVLLCPPSATKISPNWGCVQYFSAVKKKRHSSQRSSKRNVQDHPSQCKLI